VECRIGAWYIDCRFFSPPRGRVVTEDGPPPWTKEHRPYLLYGIALFSFDTIHKVYYQGSDVSPTLAAFKWVCRMLILRHVYHLNNRSRPGQSEKVRQYAIDHIHETSASAFSELCSLLAPHSLTSKIEPRFSPLKFQLYI
jgi:hypothetical protein